jgi:hypothetical protein
MRLTAATSARVVAAMAFDPVGSRVILQGGRTDYGLSDTALTDTWALSLPATLGRRALPVSHQRGGRQRAERRGELCACREEG